MPEDMEDGDEGHRDAEIDVPVQQGDVAGRADSVIDEKCQHDAQQARDEAGVPNPSPSRL